MAAKFHGWCPVCHVPRKSTVKTLAVQTTTCESGGTPPKRGCSGASDERCQRAEKREREPRRAWAAHARRAGAVGKKTTIRKLSSDGVTAPRRISSCNLTQSLVKLLCVILTSNLRSMSHSRWRSWRGRAGLGSLPGAPGLGLGRAMGLRRAFGGVEAHARECRSLGASVSGRHNSHSHLAITPHFHADGREVPSWCPAFAITTRPTSCGGGGDTTKGRPTARAPCAIASACARWRANARQPARRSTA